MTSPSREARLAELLERRSAGSLSGPEADETVALLADPAVARQVLADRRTDAALSVLLRPDGGKLAAQQVAAALAATTPSKRLHLRRRLDKSSRLPRWFALAAAGLLLALGAWLLVDRPTPNASQQLAAGEQRTLASGDRVAVRAGTMRIDGNDRWSLEAGEITVTAAKRPVGQPLVIELPDVVCTVVGTRFTLRSDGQGHDLSVDEGLVRCTATGRPPRDVAAGGRWSLTAGHERIETSLLHHPFTGESLERFSGPPAATIAAGNRPCLPGVMVNAKAQEWGFYLSDWDLGLSALRGGERLRCAIYLGRDAPAPLLRIDGLGTQPFRGRTLELPRERWVELDLALADLPVLDGPAAVLPPGYVLADLALLMPAAGSPSIFIADLRLVRVTEEP